MAWRKVAQREELAEGAVKAVNIDGTPVALTRQDGRYGALDGRCPHAGGPLGEGVIEFGYLVCPWHGREFHPLNGECVGHADVVKAYPVEVRDDGVYVDIEG